MAKLIIDDSLNKGKVYVARIELNLRKKEGHGLATSVKTSPIGGIPKQVFEQMVVDSLLSAHAEAITKYLSKHGQIQMLEYSKLCIDKWISEIKGDKTLPADPKLN